MSTPEPKPDDVVDPPVEPDTPPVEKPKRKRKTKAEKEAEAKANANANVDAALEQKSEDDAAGDMIEERGNGQTRIKADGVRPSLEVTGEEPDFHEVKFPGFTMTWDVDEHGEPQRGDDVYVYAIGKVIAVGFDDKLDIDGQVKETTRLAKVVVEYHRPASEVEGLKMEHLRLQQNGLPISAGEPKPPAPDAPPAPSENEEPVPRPDDDMVPLDPAGDDVVLDDEGTFTDADLAAAPDPEAQVDETESEGAVPHLAAVADPAPQVDLDSMTQTELPAAKIEAGMFIDVDDGRWLRVLGHSERAGTIKVNCEGNYVAEFADSEMVLTRR